MFNNEVCVYVGQAVCLKTRVVMHIRKRKDVTNVEIFDWSEMLRKLKYYDFKAMLNFLEADLIEKLRPVENVQRSKANTLEYLQRNLSHEAFIEFVPQIINAES